MKRGQISIVTGASSGLGRSIAKLLCKKEQIVYVVARSKDKLIDLQKECSKDKGKIKIISGDLTDKNFRQKLISNVIKESKKIDYLINNAGFGKLESFEKETLEDIEAMYNLNSIATEHLTQLALPYMKKKKAGRIINVASVVALSPPVYFTTYNATKYAIYGFSKTLSYELKNTGVSISVVFPSRMKTPFWEVAFKCKGLEGNDQKICKDKWTQNTKGPEKVAKYIVKNLDKKKFYFLPDSLSKISYYFLRHFHFIGNFYMKNIMLPSTKKMFKKSK
jgi:uncharacterized protein